MLYSVPPICVRMPTSADEGSSPPADPSADINDADDHESSSSGSSYIGSDAPAVPNFNCPWRTEEFHDEECSRYFDCPTHLVERRLSESGSLSQREDTVGPGHDDVPSSGNEQRSSDSEHVSDTSSLEQERASRSTSPVQQSEEEPRHRDPASASAPTLQNTSGDITSTNPEPAASNPVLLLPTRNASLPHPTTSASQTVDASQHYRRFPSPPLPPIPQQRSRPSTLELPSSSHNRGDPLGSGTFASGSNYQEPPEIILPRWQPDSDVTFCPICRSQFSFFVRKHHCRFVASSFYFQDNLADITRCLLQEMRARSVQFMLSP